MLPEGVVKIRSEFKEDELVKDYYTNNKELINIEDSFDISLARCFPIRFFSSAFLICLKL